MKSLIPEWTSFFKKYFEHVDFAVAALEMKNLPIEKQIQKFAGASVYQHLLLDHKSTEVFLPFPWHVSVIRSLIINLELMRAQ